MNIWYNLGYEIEKERKESYMSNKANSTGKIGSVKVAEDVVPVIAAIAATEVEGVASIAGTSSSDIVKLKKAPKGVRVVVDGRKVTVALAVGIDYGNNVPETSRKVQEKVKSAIESMTGLQVVDVSVHVSSVVVPTMPE